MSKEFLITMTLLLVSVGGGMYIFGVSHGNGSISATKVIYPKKKCAEPLTYSIGQFDTEFDISKETFQTAIQDAAAVWEAHTQRNLFEYDPNASFAIDLVYDERQRRTVAREATEEQLQELEQRQSGYKEQYENIKAVYDRQREEYENLQRKHEQNRKSYEEAVQYWNQRGGAPPEEYQELQERKEELNNLQSKLKEKRSQLNALVVQLNRISSESNETATKYEQTAETYADRFGTTQRFNQGEYRGGTIQIYQFEDGTDLRLVLAHELGHALGIEHVNDPAAVMHHLMQDQSITNISLATADVEALRDVCNLEHQSGQPDAQ